MHHGHHQTAYLVFSVIVAILGSWTALDLQRQVRSHAGSIRTYWLLGASLAMGMSIFTMHFVAMLGFDAGVAISYDLVPTLGSLALAVLGTAFAFMFVQTGKARAWRVASAGLAMGLAIAGMHYMGMAAMRIPMAVRYDGLIVAGSIAIAVVASCTALATVTRTTSTMHRVLGAIVLGLAICSLHYVAMAGVSFDHVVGAEPLGGGIDQRTLALWVGTGTTVLLFLALVSAMFDRRFESLSLREAASLADTEEHLRGILTQLPIDVVVLGPDRDVIFVNPPAEQLLQSRNPYDLALLEPDGSVLDDQSHPVRSAVDLGTRTDRRVVRTSSLEGVRHMEISAVRTPARRGRSHETLVMMQDVTQRIEAEETLQHTQKLETIGQLTGGVAHDFNNLLTPIIGGLDMLSRDRNNTDRSQRVIEGALQASQRAAVLVQRLLAFARRQALQTRTVDLSDLLLGLTDLIVRTLGPTMEITIEVEPGTYAQVDPGQLELAILNLAVNARDAMSDGGELDITVRHVEVGVGHPSRLPNGAYVQIVVADTGTGMTDETARRAIEPFFSTKGIGKGTGLGLSMAHGLAAQSQGALLIETQPGRGTRIHVLFPLADAPSEAAVANDCTDDEPTFVEPVLLVDDEDLVRQTTADLMTDMGYQVVQASSGAQALRILGERPEISAMITDFLMPGMTGAELAQEVGLRRPGMPIMLVTGYALPDRLPSNLSRLQKPFTRRDLARSMRGMAKVGKTGTEARPA